MKHSVLTGTDAAAKFFHCFTTKSGEYFAGLQVLLVFSLPYFRKSFESISC